MEPTALTLNAGSATVKAALFSFEAHPRLLRREVWTTAPSDRMGELPGSIASLVQDARLMAIGHRIVHGGPGRYEAETVTPQLLTELEQLVRFAPNHLPDAISLIKALKIAHPSVPHIACFDTAFHRDLPEVARRLPIPRSYDSSGIRRYGFHGLSYEYVMEELHRSAPAHIARGSVVLAHLGNGSSLTAVHDGRSMDTSMCLTPLGGVMMSTRSGDMDPGLVAFIARQDKLNADQIEDLFGRRSGLLAVSGSTGDMRQLLDLESANPACRLAVDMYVYQIRKCIGAFAAALGRLDGVVFTGGIGEHAPDIRGRICAGLEFLGITLDTARNSNNDRTISRADARVVVQVIPTNEESMIARAAFRILGHTS
jgi:acetate kinase